MSMLFPVRFLEKLPFHPLSLFPLFLLTILLYKWLSNITRDASNTLPSPPKLPILGNLHQLGKLPHRSLGLLSTRYGELMLLHLGNKPTLIVSSPEAAQQIMKTHDMIFANRPRLRVTDKIFYGGNDIGFGRYGEEWRRMKSIAVEHLLSTKKVQSFRSIREEEVTLMIQNIKSSNSLGSINLSAMFLGFAKDVVSRTALGRKYSNNFEKLLKEFVNVMGATSVGDYIPWLGFLDRVTGLEGQAEKVRKGFDDFLKKVIQEHIDRPNVDDDLKDFVHVLLQVQREDPANISTDTISAIILDMFIGGIEPTYTLLEWAMAEVLKHPGVMKELQHEVRETIKGKTEVTEDDLENMKYLKATLKETLRLHPPFPMLLFRESSKDVKINSYDIAKGTQVIINASAIQRNKACWEEPEEFNPERFLNSSMETKSQNFQFIPFGSGRRGCPGPLFSLISAELLLARLVYEFHWKLPGGAASETLNMEEKAGLAIQRLHPLMVIATTHSPR